MVNEAKTEFRLVCAKQGIDEGHKAHAYLKPQDRVQQALIDANHNSDTAGVGTGRVGDYYTGEAPWRIQSREIGPWEEVT